MVNEEIMVYMSGIGLGLNGEHIDFDGARIEYMNKIDLG